jgi:hypothetical protein
VHEHRFTTVRGGVRLDDSIDYELPFGVLGELALRIHHDEIVMPLVRRLRLFELEGLSPEAEVARARLATHLEAMLAAAARLEERRARNFERSLRQARRRQTATPKACVEPASRGAGSTDGSGHSRGRA